MASLVLCLLEEPRPLIYAGAISRRGRAQLLALCGWALDLGALFCLSWLGHFFSRVRKMLTSTSKAVSD